MHVWRLNINNVLWFCQTTLTQNENVTLFIMGITIPEITHMYLPMQEMNFNHV